MAKKKEDKKEDKKKEPKKKETKKKIKSKEKPKPRKRNPSIKNLTEDQRIFIEEKVKELGSIEEVERFYKLTDAVSYFAMKTAKKLKLSKGNKNETT